MVFCTCDDDDDDDQQKLVFDFLKSRPSREIWMPAKQLDKAERPD